MMSFGSPPSRDNPSKQPPLRGKLPLGPGMCWVCWLTLLTLVGFIIGCGGPSKPSDSPSKPTATTPKVEEAPPVEQFVSTEPLPTVEKEFPQGDTSVPAEQGGPGFKGEGWETANPGPLGAAGAKRGGLIVSYIPSWPENLRVYGTGNNTFLNSIIEGLCYESLCGMHPETLETIPSLASHWKVSEDKMKFTFRINPLAHWSDGKPVVAEDVAATYRLIMDDTLVDPMNKVVISVMDEPKIISKYMFEVTCKEKHWRNFLTFTAMKILPAHEIKGMTGADFLKKYNFSYTATSGPYVVRQSDIQKNVGLTVSRREDYWGDSQEANKGLNNFSRIRFIVIRDGRLAFDKACKGELDFYNVNTAKWWVEEVVGDKGTSPLEQVRQGYLVAQKVFNRSPTTVQGDVFNMRNAPLDDKRVRLALAHMFDRRKLIEKFAYNEYLPLKSYYPGDAENPNNKMVEYDPKRALALLGEAGFKERDSDGVLMRNGQRLTVTLTYDEPGFLKYYTAYQETCRKVGVEIVLKQVDDAALWKSLQERTFQFAPGGLTGMLFPDPRAHWTSKMAESRGSNNFAGFNSKEADEIIAKYDKNFDVKERTVLLRELDGVVFNEHPYMLQWYLPCERVIWWNKFGRPKTVFTKYGDWREVFSTWWFDPELDAELKKARAAGSKLENIPPRELRPWDKPAAQP
ncbi:MAG: extracellular solute-binding protein [Planctomycetes bacterium]|nr:extracellular solute-binding protein [Planctomycetota bacterium]